VARSDYHPHPQALPQFRQSAEGTHERAAERSAVDEVISTGNDQGRTRHRKPTTADHQKALQNLRLYELLDTVHTDQTGVFLITSQQNYQYIMVGGHPSGCKLHLLQINEEPNQRQNDYGLPKNGRQDEALGTWVKAPPFGQRVFGRIQSMH
jgi:hypothetical protein